MTLLLKVKVLLTVKHMRSIMGKKPVSRTSRYKLLIFLMNLHNVGPGRGH